MQPSLERKPGALPWDSLLVWGLVLLAVYGLREVFLVAFITFILSYLVRTIVVSIARRLRPDGEHPGLERWLTLVTFAGIAALLWALISIVGPQFVLQGRVLMASAHHQDPEQILNHVLSRTVGAYLFARTYGDAGDPRYQAALERFQSEGRIGEGAFAEFGRLQARLRSRFEIAYEAAEQQRLRDQVLHGGAESQRFADWFLATKAPALVAAQHAAYLARWQATHPDAGSNAADSPALDRQLGELALDDVRARPTELKPLLTEWEDSVAAAEWRRLQSSPAYLNAFRDWFERQRGKDATVPYDVETYLALRAAYPEGTAAFNKVYQARVSGADGASALLQSDFRRATEIDLARKWWASSAAAASLREHLQQEPAEAAAAVAGRVEGAMKSLISVPAAVVTALLLTILITFDMAKLKQGALRLRESRIAPIYDKVVPNLLAMGRLIGRSFAAQGLIAIFNTLLTLVLMRTLGLHNELLLATIVFVASFIPVLGVILSGIPIALQALLQPDGSLVLALYAMLGIAAIHVIESTVLSPRIVGRILHLHPVLVLAVLIIGEHLFGVWGLLLGVPISVYIIHVAVLADGIPGVYEPTNPD